MAALLHSCPYLTLVNREHGNRALVFSGVQVKLQYMNGGNACKVHQFLHSEPMITAAMMNQNISI